jgi:hypothetical protein
MKPTCTSLCAAIRGAFFFAALTSASDAQNQTWIRQFGTLDNDYVRAAALDGSGGMYVCGSTEGSLAGSNAGSADCWLARYNGAGNRAWIQQFGTNAGEGILAAAPDGLGGVYVCGSTSGNLAGPNAGGSDAWLGRYDGSGSQSWIRQIGTSSHDRASAAASDGAGGVFVGGQTGGSLGGPSAGVVDAWLARYDGAGNQLWIRQPVPNVIDLVHDLEADGQGGVYVIGAADNVLGTETDVWLARYDSAGNQIWSRQYFTPGFETARSSAADANGLYVCGDVGSSGNPDAWVARYDSAGNQSWYRRFGTSVEDVAYTAARDGLGGVYIGGGTRGSLGGPSAGSWDAWLAHYDPAGNQSWILQFGGGSHDSGNAAVPDESGGLYFCGDSRMGSRDAWIARYEVVVTERYCRPFVPNSTSQAGALNATGSNVVAANDLRLEGSLLPPNSFGYFLTSRLQGLVIGAGGSQGPLCLGGAIGRYVGPGQVMSSGTMGSFSLALDLTATPQPVGSVAVQPGETWNFQAWHRDTIGGVATSNFTDAISVTFH